MKKIARILCIVMAVTVLFSGCGETEAEEGSVKIYYAAIESGDYYEGWANQLKEQADINGWEFEVGYAEKSLETQISQLKGAVEDGYNVFLCGLVSPETATAVQAVSGELPIVFINNAPEEGQLEKDRYIYVASDEFMAGQYQAEYILEKFSGRDEINVAVLKGPKGASGAEGRTKGLKQTLKASGKKINYVFEDYADWSSDTARELMGIFLRTGNPVDCVAANNDDMALGGLAAFEDAGVSTDSVLFLGVDASEDGCQAILEGKMDFTVYQPVSAQISAAVEAAGCLAKGQSADTIEGISEDGKYILVPFEKVDADNAAQYQK